MADEGPEVQGTSGEEQRQTPESEEELRARIDEQLRKVRVQDLLLETAVSVLNLTARRIAKEDERDLDQAKVGIEAVRSLVELLDPEPAAQVRNAISEVQMLYAREAQEGRTSEPDAGSQEEPASAQPKRSEGGSSGTQRGPSRLWTPPGSGA